jgi:hypothetical protein
MKDEDIRSGLHAKLLRKHHACADTLVIDELGLNHGRCRADVVVINGHLNGFEIKSDRDSLRRFGEQARVYSAVFDHSVLVTTSRHLARALKLAPDWWGITLCSIGPRRGVRFDSVRRAKRNPAVDPLSLVQLLWRSEVLELLRSQDLPQAVFRQPRAALYRLLVDMLSTNALRRTVRECLKTRRNWRYPALPSPSGGSSPHNAMS